MNMSYKYLIFVTTGYATDPSCGDGSVPVSGEAFIGDVEKAKASSGMCSLHLIKIIIKITYKSLVE